MYLMHGVCCEFHDLRFETLYIFFLIWEIFFGTIDIGLVHTGGITFMQHGKGNDRSSDLETAREAVVGLDSEERADRDSLAAREFYRARYTPLGSRDGKAMPEKKPSPTLAKPEGSQAFAMRGFRKP